MTSNQELDALSLECLAIVERIQQAMMIEPFRPDITDVVMLIEDWRVQNRDTTDTLKALQEVTGSDNKENPWLGVTAAVALLRAKNERLRAMWEKWRPSIERRRDWLDKDGNERQAKGYAAMLADFDAALERPKDGAYV